MLGEKKQQTFSQFKTLEEKRACFNTTNKTVAATRLGKVTVLLCQGKYCYQGVSLQIIWCDSSLMDQMLVCFLYLQQREVTGSLLLLFFSHISYTCCCMFGLVVCFIKTNTTCVVSPP